jgi:nucleotide-binding universal stress UspA family protein
METPEQINSVQRAKIMTIDSKFLVSVNGSKHSQYAFEVAKKLAEAADAHLTVQHVADTDVAWQLFGHDVPGLIGAGPWIAAYEALRNSMLFLGNALIDECRNQLSRVVVSSETFVDEGNPVEEICLRSQEADLVIIGHRSIAEGNADVTSSEFQRCSIAEGLVRQCKKPLLIVQAEPATWTKVKILATARTVQQEYVGAAIKFAYAISAHPEIVIVDSDSDEKVDPERVIELYPGLTAQQIITVPIEIEMLLSSFSSAMTGEDVVSPLADDDGLYVIPTYCMDGRTHVLVGPAADYFVGASVLANMLLWPQPALSGSDDAKAEFELERV